MGERDRELLAKTLMAEAGNQGVEGMLAAGSVIMNRARGGGYGQGVEGVIMKPGAFSPWNSVTGFAGGQQGQNMAAIRPTMQAYQIADALLSGQYEDPTGGATHFYNPDISNPSWGTRGGGNWKRIGAHVFGRADDPQWRTAAISTQGAAKGDGAVAANQPRVLTQDDIETYNLTDAVPGDIATPEDIAKMGAGYTLNMPVPPEATQGVSVNQALANDAMDALGKTPSGLRTITVGENPAMPRAGAQPIALDSNMAGGVSDGREVTYAPRPAATGPVPASLLQQPVDDDPLSNLTRSQRLMIAGAAIADAGAALQGRQGGAVAGLLGRFNEIADMNRKREAARQRAAMVAQLFGGETGLTSPTSGAPEDMAARKRQIFQAMAAGLIEPVTGKAMIDDIDAQAAKTKEAETALTSQNLGVAAIDALLASPNLSAVTGFKGTVNQFLEQFGAAPEYSNLMSYVDQLRGLNFVEAYQQLKGGGPITENEGKAATAARTRVDRALRGRPEDLVMALREARKLFSEAMEKNPAYRGQRGGLTEDDMEYLKPNE